MKNYKEIYETLTNDIDTQKNKKQELETTLISLHGEEINLTIKEMDLKEKIEDLKEERKSVANQKTRIVVIAANTLLVLLLIAAVYLETSILSSIAALGKRILAGIGLFIGFGNLYMCALIGINLVRDNIIKKIQNKNKDNERYIELTEILKQKNKELAKVTEEKQNITEKITKKEEEIQETINQLDISTQELEKFKEEIVSLVTNQTIETINSINETKQTKPYIRRKTKEN